MYTYVYRYLWTHSDCICLCFWLGLANAMCPLLLPLLLLLRSSRLQFPLLRSPVCVRARVCVLFFRIIVKWQRNKGRRNWVKSRAAFLLYFDLRAMHRCLFVFPLPFPNSLLPVSQPSRLSPRATDRYRGRGTDRETKGQTDRETRRQFAFLVALFTYSLPIYTYVFAHTHTLTSTHTQMCVYTVPL